MNRLLIRTILVGKVGKRMFSLTFWGIVALAIVIGAGAMLFWLIKEFWDAM